MNYLKRIFINWFCLGICVGLIPYIITLIKETDDISLSRFWLILLVFLPIFILIIYRKVMEVYYGNPK